MADHSTIEWTDATWNPITGCSVVSPGCTNCYAMKLAGTRLKHIDSRKGLTRDSKAGPVWTGEVRLNEQWLDQPLRWKRPRKIFVCAHGDLFAEGVPDEWIDQVFAVMALAPQHTFQVLTKRAARMREYINGIPSKIPSLGRMPLERIHLEAAGHMEGDGGFMDTLKQHGNVYSLYCSVPWPLPNVWLGVSVEDQQRADERIPDLLAAPAAIRFVSAEPLLGPIDFTTINVGGNGELDATRPLSWQEIWDSQWSPEATGVPADEALDGFLDWYNLSSMPTGLAHPGLDWIIVGGESGKDARPMHPDWVRSIRDQCSAAKVPFFFKQWGSWADFTDIDPKPVCAEDRIFTETGDVVGVGVDYGRKGMVDRDWREQGAAWMGRVSKTYAGRLLDGIEHNGMPGSGEAPAT